MNKDDVIQAIDAAEAQLDQLVGAIRQRATAHLPEGDWTVRDALSHMAARANDVPTMVARFTSAAQGGPRPNIDDINAEQVSQRTGRSVDDLMDEVRRGYAAAREAARGLTDELLNRQVTDFRGNPTSLGEVIRNAYARHQSAHLDTIQKATNAGSEAGSDQPTA